MPASARVAGVRRAAAPAAGSDVRAVDAYAVILRTVGRRTRGTSLLVCMVIPRTVDRGDRMSAPFGLVSCQWVGARAVHRTLHGVKIKYITCTIYTASLCSGHGPEATSRTIYP